MAQKIREEADLLVNILGKEGEKMSIILPISFAFAVLTSEFGPRQPSADRKEEHSTYYIGTSVLQQCPAFGHIRGLQWLGKLLLERRTCLILFSHQSDSIFGRTSTEKHKEICQDVYLQPYKNNTLEKQTKERSYCETCSKFLADRQHTVVAQTSAHVHMGLNPLRPQIEASMKKTWKEGRCILSSAINADGEIIDARLKGGTETESGDSRFDMGRSSASCRRPDRRRDEGEGYVITTNYTDEWRQWWFNPENNTQTPRSPEMNSFGDFVNRVLRVISAKYDGVVPNVNNAPDPVPTGNNGDEYDPTFASEIDDLLKDYINAMESVKLRLGIQTVMAISARGNLNALAQAVPERLSVDILRGHTLGNPAHLFKRIDEKMADVWQAMFGGGASMEQPKEAAVSKRKAAAAAKKAGAKNDIANNGNAVKMVEMVQLEDEIAAQGIWNAKFGTSRRNIDKGGGTRARRLHPVTICGGLVLRALASDTPSFGKLSKLLFIPGTPLLLERPRTYTIGQWPRTPTPCGSPVQPKLHGNL
ncbi:hypothetical protein BOTBODRAFT_41696 [Botryobasidium botryosum FD-172 SS1]|uniref:Methionyl/Leucyl tRNA synthetase domain-containing protein n=1 Tax=Botryobasidium botryosum (strain FD-172 SS1) TaxID=930990 RepID=A0A067MXS7_BOTB1|nr:hypothetical protein BOTBODRAFT_41696 [Botryobasidium botryosum FD-172 SS1]